MNKLVAVIASIGLLLAIDGCGQNSRPYGAYNGYGGGYPQNNYGGYNGGYNNGYNNSYNHNNRYGGYNNGYNNGYNGYNNGYGYNNKSRPQKSEEQMKQEMSVKALRDAAKNGADPASTLYQQMLIQQMH